MDIAAKGGTHRGCRYVNLPAFHAFSHSIKVWPKPNESCIDLILKPERSIIDSRSGVKKSLLLPLAMAVKYTLVCARSNEAVSKV